MVAFADDLLLDIRGESVRAVENYANVELSKITVWSKNKIIFNKEKSKAMLVSRRNRREQREIKVYLNNKPLEQVIRMKYLCIIIDHKFRFQEHISYAAERCTKLIYSLSKMAKLSWGIKNAAIETIYKGAILPLLTYGAPVWIDAMKYKHNRQKYIRVQRLINIKIAKAYRTTSSEALYVLTGMTPINIKLEEVVKRYINKKTVSHTFVLDSAVELKHWLHPADAVTIIEVAGNEEASVQAYTDGSKHGQGVGSGAAIFIGNEIVAQIKLKLDNRCSNNQAEQLAIVKALEAIESLHNKLIHPRTATIFTDGRVALDSFRNVNNHAYLVEEIRNRVARLLRYEWKVTFSWVKAHVGIYGNELADRLAKEAARSKGTSIAFNRIPVSTLCYEAAKEARQKWQDEWTTCTKAATTKQFSNRTGQAADKN